MFSVKLVLAVYKAWYSFKIIIKQLVYFAEANQEFECGSVCDSSHCYCCAKIFIS
jgi:hypothetical protein